MPKVSGYPQAKEALTSHIVDKEPRELDRVTVATILGCSISAAGNYMQMLAREYPNGLRYSRGVLIITNPIASVADLPAETRLKMKEHGIKQIKELTNKIVANHLKHDDKQALKEALDKLKKLVDSL